MSNLLVLTGVIAAFAAGPPPECRPTGAQLRWIETSLAAWEHVRARALSLPEAPLPRMVFFDRYCTFGFPADSGVPRSLQVRLGDAKYGVVPAEHHGSITLPDGRTIPARPATFASLMPGDTSAFLLIALEDVWLSDPVARQFRESWDEYLRRVLVHEMTHTRQLAAWIPLARIAGGRVGLVDLDDDVIQQRFDTVPGFRRAVEREIALLYQAAGATGDRQRSLVVDALSAMRDRRERYFGGENAPWSEIEQLWLDLEGAGQWAALAHVKHAMPRLGPRTALGIVRESRSFWSQEEGLALYLALDAFVPGWQQQVFSAEPKSSVELLEGALYKAAGRQPQG